jgi:hypothetical protein
MEKNKILLLNFFTRNYMAKYNTHKLWNLGQSGPAENIMVSFAGVFTFFLILKNTIHWQTS